MLSSLGAVSSIRTAFLAATDQMTISGRLSVAVMSWREDGRLVGVVDEALPVFCAGKQTTVVVAAGGRLFGARWNELDLVCARSGCLRCVRK